MDAELYKHLMFLKHYEGDVQELYLTFSVQDNLLGVQRVVELKPGGSKIDVVNQNRMPLKSNMLIKYVYRGKYSF